MRFDSIASSYSNVLSPVAQVSTIVCMSTEPDYWPVYGADKLRIIKRYPDHWAAINALFDMKEDFRLLCHEYGLAAKALARLDDPSAIDATGRRDEYRDIVRALESEILKYVGEYAS